MFNKFVISIFILIMIISNSSYPQSVKDRLDMYKSVTLTADLSWLTPNEKKMIPILIEAAKYMDDLFWFQAYGNKDELMGKIDKLYRNNPEEAEYIKKLAMINYGPWERLD